LRQGVAKGLIIEAFKKEAEQFEKNFQESKLPEDVNQEAMSLLIESVYKKAWHNNATQKNTPARKKTQSNSHHNDLGGHSLAAA
jgi:Sec-independent protein translocase protein TatA